MKTVYTCDILFLVCLAKCAKWENVPIKTYLFLGLSEARFFGRYMAYTEGFVITAVKAV